MTEPVPEPVPTTPMFGTRQHMIDQLVALEQLKRREPDMVQIEAQVDERRAALGLTDDHASY